MMVTNGLLLPLTAAITLADCTVCAFLTPSSIGVTSTRKIVSTETALYSTPTRALPEGISKIIKTEGNGRVVRAGDLLIVKYFCNAVGSETAFARSDRQRVMAGDNTFIPGFDVAVRSMKEGERAVVHISNPKYAYGSAGVPPFVPPNSEVEIDIELLGMDDSVGLGTADFAGLDGMGMDGPVSRPRTPGAIAAAYEERMREKAINAPPELEGVEWVINKLKTSYFFGLFEGETGQEAPWYLKPNITFPIAFLVVGAAFGASVLGGAISERGMPTTDELDELVISSNVNSLAVALALFQM